MSNILDIFNQKTIEFIADVGLICPDIKDLQPIANIGLSLDRMAAIRIFDKYADKYESYILAKDEAFLLVQDYESENMDVIARLKTVWTTLTPENKDTIWKYIQLLLLLHSKHKQATRNK